MHYLLAGILLLPLFSSEHQLPASNPEQGKLIFKKHCKVCHGEKGDGKTFAANALNPMPRDFTSARAKKELTRERMIRSVTQGRPGSAMMPWENNLSKQEIRAVVAYIRHELMRLPNEK